jgi:predicted Zn-dependent protease
VSAAPGQEIGARARALVARRPRGVELELYEKRGRSRRFVVDAAGESFEQSHESGWAARGGDERGSFFVAASGAPPARLELPEPAPPALRLPDAETGGSGAVAAGLDAPLVSESEGFALATGVSRELARELPGAVARLIRFDDGASEWTLVSSRGIDVRARARSCALWIEAEAGEARVAAEFVARSAAELKPLGVARRVVDRLRALAAPADPGEPALVVLAPPLAARLLEAVAPRLSSGGSSAAAVATSETAEPFAAAAVSIVDDLADARGVLASPFDGEGLPSRAVRVVDAGRFATPLLPWYRATTPERRGGALRPGWRDLPRAGPTQLFVEPDPAAGPGELVGALERGAYLLAAEGGVQLDADGDGFAVAVSGFALEAGRATRALGPCRLVGRHSGWLAGVQAVGRDLAFAPGAALFGAPTLVVAGLELRPLASGGTATEPAR